ncbi:hypothetical protein MAR_013863 [Mya arenaria]|uniref:Uncharacterized protein n=1 Tax=Mya arenaria TaxID=6604 RepID=A0ABY7G4E0_MYAAR|nr:hypothetical protein MAR_013863 [Mya arenaria]
MIDIYLTDLITLLSRKYSKSDMSRAPLFSLTVVCLFARSVNAVALNAACSATSDCTVTNSECSKMISTCSKGTCTCKNGYMEDSSTCSGTTCQTTTCACPTGTIYHSGVKMCITDGKKLISEVCTADSDCYEGTTESECVANTGTTTPKYCRCKSGYVLDSTYFCTKPNLDTACTSAVGCVSMTSTSMWTSSGQVSETCQNNMCACPSGSDKFTYTYSSADFKICQTTATGSSNDKADGATCTASNTCKSKVCYQCPGDSTSKCVTITAGNGADGISGLVVSLLVPCLLLLK